MKTILACNQKGGADKSLCADELSFSFERTGTPVSFYDLDAQEGTLHVTHGGEGCESCRYGHAGGVAGGFRRLAQGGRRCGHSRPHHVSRHRAADAHVQGDV